MQVNTRTSATLKTLIVLVAAMTATKTIRMEARQRNLKTGPASRNFDTATKKEGDGLFLIPGNCQPWLSMPTRLMTAVKETLHTLAPGSKTKSSSHPRHVLMQENVVTRVRTDSNSRKQRKTNGLREQTERKKKLKRLRKLNELLAMTPEQRKVKWIKGDWARFKRRMKRAERFAKARNLSESRKRRLLNRIRRGYDMGEGVYLTREAQIQRILEQRKSGFAQRDPISVNDSLFVNQDEVSRPVDNPPFERCRKNGSSIGC